MSLPGSLRGAQDHKLDMFSSTDDHDIIYNIQTSRQLSESERETIILSQQLSFQIIMSCILAGIILSQLTLITYFFLHRSKRVLEFAQPLIVNIGNFAAVAISCACYLYLFTSDAGCAVREPIIFTSLTVMGATIAGRAWRISVLFSPMMSLGNAADSSESSTRIERSRQFVLHFLRRSTGRENLFSGAPSRIHVQITIYRIFRAILLLVLPQLLLQVLIVAIPYTRSRQEVSYFHHEQVTIGRLECQSDAGQTWTLALSVLFATIPYCLAWLLNLRPKSELERLPEMVDERANLRDSLWVFIRVLITCAPLIGMSVMPNAYTYAIMCSVLSLPLCICYFISYTKLAAINTNTTMMRTDFGTGTDGRNSIAYAVRMAEMYVKIGRVEETVQLVEETLSLWRKGGGNKTNLLGTRQENEQIGSGFSRSDLAELEPDELELIIQLLKIKGRTMISLYGHEKGSAMFAKLHVDILKIYESCPAASKLKDSSIIFPVYNYLGIQIRGGAFTQDDRCQLEVDLAERFHYEAQVQAFHLARALANLADVYGRTNQVNEALKYYGVMQSIYMQEHGPRLTEIYAVDRCAVCIATSALWYLQLGQVDKAIERCDYVAGSVLPLFDKKDTIGLYHTVTSVIRVLKWNGHVDRARDLYDQYLPDGTENHFAVGSVHKPMCLLLKICEGSSEKYSICDADIALALNFEVNDFSDNIFMSDGWSLNSLGAELCLHLARRLKPGEMIREQLVKKGIELSSIADTRVKSSNGMVKHILAYEAHKSIHLDLLQLAGLDAKTPRNIIYDVSKDKLERRGKLRKDGDWNTRLRSSNKESNIVSRLVLKEENSGSTGAGSGHVAGSSGSAEDLAARKFGRRLSQMSHHVVLKQDNSDSGKASELGVRSFGSVEFHDDAAARGIVRRFSQIHPCTKEDSHVILPHKPHTSQ